MMPSKAEHWADPLAVEILRLIGELAGRCARPFCVVGATARDLVFFGIHGIRLGAATSDIDFAVGVGSWTDYEAFRAALMATGRFDEDGKRQHLLRYRAAGGYPLDLIPYGGVVGSDQNLRWPPERDPVMNLTGYAEVVASAVLIELPGVTVPVASIPGFVMLKLFAWADRWQRTRRDAEDIASVVRSYQQIPDVCDRLYGESFDLLTDSNHDLDRASIALLGRDVAAIARPPTREALVSLLQDVTRRARLLGHLGARAALGAYRVDALTALREFERGLQSGQGQHEANTGAGVDTP